MLSFGRVPKAALLHQQAHKQSKQRNDCVYYLFKLYLLVVGVAGGVGEERKLVRDKVINALHANVSHCIDRQDGKNNPLACYFGRALRLSIDVPAI